MVSGNRTTYYTSQGGGIYMSTGLVTHCRIISNRCNDSYPYGPSAYSDGGGVYISGGTLRNCVIAGNRAQHDYATRHPITRGAGIYIAGGRVEQCTVSRNSVVDAYGRGDGIYMTNGVVWNSIVYYNFDDSVTNYTADHENIYQAGGSVNYSCTTNSQGLSGVSNVFSDPGFANRWTNDFRLLPGSPCLDSGTNLTEVTTDIAGNPRPQDGNGDAQARHDMGAYEASPVTNGSFRINFTTVPEESIGAADVAFTASVAGTNTTGLTYAWDFTNDGTPDAYAAVVTNSYGAPGYYTVKLIVSNSVSESATVIKQAAVRVFPSVVFVATTGSHTFPFDTWAKASTNLPPAINAAFPGTTVTLGPGAYAVTSPVSVRRGISVLGSEGPSNTAVERVTNANTRIFTVSHSNAVVELLTIRNGWWDGSAPYNHEGGGVLLIAGMVRNCVISNNYVRGQPNSLGRGGGACLWGGTLRNCLVFLNEARCDNQTAGGGGVYMIGGSVENCTVVSNYTWRSDAGGETDATRGGGIWMSGGGVTNTIVVDNRIRVVTNVAVQISVSGATNIGYSCSPDLTHDPGGTGNITNAPMFVATTDYRLVLGSPGIDAGVNQAWMTGAADLDGNNRIRMSTVDMGAYEYQPPPGTIFTIH